MASEVMNVEEVRAVLSLSRNAVYEAIARKEIPSIRIGRRLLVPRVQLERMLNGEALMKG